MSTENTTDDSRLPAAPSGGWILTATGRAIWPLDPVPGDFDIMDIAHALSMICRYTGHVRQFYSVAQHCVIVSEIVPQEDAFAGLMHDATEAYLCDLARPVKHAMPEYRRIERHLERFIAAEFSLPFPLPPSVKHADLVMLATERRDLMPPSPYRWSSTEGVEPLARRISPLAPGVAKELFLKRFNELSSLNAKTEIKHHHA